MHPVELRASETVVIKMKKAFLTEIQQPLVTTKYEFEQERKDIKCA